MRGWLKRIRVLKCQQKHRLNNSQTFAMNTPIKGRNSRKQKPPSSHWPLKRPTFKLLSLTRQESLPSKMLRARSSKASCRQSQRNAISSLLTWRPKDRRTRDSWNLRKTSRLSNNSRKTPINLRLSDWDRESMRVKRPSKITTQMQRTFRMSLKRDSRISRPRS